MKITRILCITFSLSILVFSLLSAQPTWKELDPINSPPPRKGHTMVSNSPDIILFGGINEGGILNDTWSFDGEDWNQIDTPISPPARHEHASVTDGENYWAFFGEGDNGLLDDIWKFNLETGDWELMSTNGTKPTPRKGHTAVYHAANNTVYLVGGTTANGESSELFAYNVANNQWTAKPDMVNFCITNHGAAILDNTLVIFGGNSLFAPFSDHFFTYNFDTEDWDSVSTEGDEFIGRSDFATMYDDNSVHVVGGKNADGPLDDHGVVDFDIQTEFGYVSTIIDINTPHSAAIAALYTSLQKSTSNSSTQILMFGGFDGTNYLNTTWYYTDCMAIMDSLDVTICEGENYEGYEEEGVYEDTFEAANGCDSVRILNLSVLPKIDHTITLELCYGYGFEGYYDTGLYLDTLVATNGCDSLRTIDLTILEKNMDTTAVSICYGESYEGYGQTGIYVDTLIASNGCDSIEVVDLDVNDQIIDTIMMTICPDESYEGYSEGGTFVDTLIAINQCDSTRVLELEVQPHVQLTDTIIVADDGSGNGSIQILVNGQIEDFIIEWSNGADSSTITDLEAGDYGVTLTDTIQCSTEFNITVPLVTSTKNELLEVDLKVLPNPIVNKMRINLKYPHSVLDIQRIRMVDMKGGVIKIWEKGSFEIMSNELWMKENMRSGIYMLQILIRDKIYTNKVVVLR